MQALKGLVVLLTILIVVAMTVIAYGLYRKSDEPDFKFFALGGQQTNQATSQPPVVPPLPKAAPGTSPTTSPMPFGDVMLSLPEGCTISSVSGDGARIFLKIGPADNKCARVVIVDALSGAILGTLKANP